MTKIHEGKHVDFLTMLHQLWEYGDKGLPITFEITFQGITRTLTLGKRFVTLANTWGYFLGETYCPTFVYNTSEINKFVLDICTSVKGANIDYIERLS
jgi:hypothetical protein